MPIKTKGFPVAYFIDNAAPPLASPSALVKITPSISRRLLNSVATFTASWPIIASATKKV